MSTSIRALNLFSLTRAGDSQSVSKLAQALSGRSWYKSYSPHEVASLCALVRGLAQVFRAQFFTGCAAALGSADWVSFFDGFYFSYTIEHISKEFDLLKLSSDGDCVLNIELKSESVEEDRIRRQLDQNRYYLSHISRTILSYTYVMETDTLYCLNDHGYLKKSSFEELAQAMQRPVLQQYAEEDIGQFFRAQEYLISPVREPEKLLNGRYFLTNQQADFRRQILELLEDRRASGEDEDAKLPVLSLTGNAGTGKTLLLFDLAIGMSRKRRVLFLHGGPLLEGHRIIDRRLRKVTVLSGTDPVPAALEAYACILVDEANRFPAGRLEELLQRAEACGVPCIFSFDPHSILGPTRKMEEAEAVITQYETGRMELSGNIRINRPIFSFLRTLFHLKDRPGHTDYSCIDVLYAGDRGEEQVLTAHYLARGYEHIDIFADPFGAAKIIGQEFEKVLMVLDGRFYYDETLHLCADGAEQDVVPTLYEGLSRAREKLCLIITGDRTLFSRILAIRTRE